MLGLTIIDVPGALAGSTNPFGINPQRDIVGYYTDSSKNLHGFLWTKGKFKTIDVPANFGLGTFVYGINSEGDIVGAYGDTSGVTHGFLLQNYQDE
jgi:probable HAF family extracellular repeat protein